MNSKLMRFWNVIYPVLMYYVVSNLVMFIIGFFWQTTNQNYMAQHIIVTIVVFPVVYSYYQKPGEKKLFMPVSFVLLTLLGACSGIALNNLIALSPLMQHSTGYQEVSQAFFGSTLLLEILGSCMLTPILEEVLYRGVAYSRLKQWLGVKPAILLSAALFGLMHFNLVQFVYAGILGILLACIAERYGLPAAILAHAAANLMAVLRAETSFLNFISKGNLPSYLMWTALFVLISLSFIWILFRKKLHQ